MVPTRAVAGVVGSPHDFATGPYTQSTIVAPGGICSACHIMHGAKDTRLWARDLSFYRSKLNVADGVGDNNYLVPLTLQCYDCHDYARSFGGSSVSDETNVLDAAGTSAPPKGAFTIYHRPQDIAFGIRYSGGPPSGGYTGDWTDDGPGGTVTGYFENDPPYGSPGRDETRFGVGSPPGTPGVGGHYFRSGDPVPGSIRAGDKIPCSDCHDPHDYTNQAFIRKNIAGTTETIDQASEYMSNTPPSGRFRNNTISRNICRACHTLSGSQQPKSYSDVNPSYASNVQIVQRTTTVPEHGDGSAVPCTQCHKHNVVAASCNGCHFYPGLSGGVQATSTHRKHVNLLSDSPVGRGYQCATCHSNYAHNQSGVTGPGDWSAKFNRAFVDVNFDNAWNPGATYDNSTRTCRGLYCHGDTAAQLAWGGTSTKPVWDNTATAPCGSCHATGAQLRTANHPVHLDQAGVPYGPNTIDNAACANGQGCHTAYGLSPSASHVDRVKSFRRSSADPSPVAFAATAICVNCHSDATTPAGIGDNLARANWSDNGYRIDCLTCHNKTPGKQASTQVGGGGGAAPNIEAYWATSGHGAPAIDNALTTDNTTPGVNQVPPVDCRYCHNTAAAHFGPGKNVVNPWRLAGTTGFDNVSGGLDLFCRTRCHIPSPPPRHVWIVSAGETKGPADTHPTGSSVVPDPAYFQLPPATMPLQGAMTNKGSVPDGGQNFLCVTCHDPHGIGSPEATPRSFRGVNTGTVVDINNDTNHMLRYDYGAGSGSPLCRSCHK